MIMSVRLTVSVAFLCCIALPGAYTCTAQTDSLVQAYDTAHTSETQGRLAATISVLLSDVDEAKSTDWARRGYALAGGVNLPAAITCANQLGIWHKDHGRYDSAVQYYKTALEKARALNIQRYINGELSNLGQTYGLMASMPKRYTTNCRL